MNKIITSYYIITLHQVTTEKNVVRYNDDYDEDDDELDMMELGFGLGLVFGFGSRSLDDEYEKKEVRDIENNLPFVHRLSIKHPDQC